MSRAYVNKLRTEITELESAISEIRNAGQSMSLDDGLSYTRASYLQMTKDLKNKKAQLARATGRNPLFQSVNMSGGYS